MKTSQGQNHCKFEIINDTEPLLSRSIDTLDTMIKHACVTDIDFPLPDDRAGTLCEQIPEVCNSKTEIRGLSNQPHHMVSNVKTDYIRYKSQLISNSIQITVHFLEAFASSGPFRTFSTSRL